MELHIGKVVKSYEIQELIGAGGFGAVYRAIQPSVGREVAIKIILPEHANHPEFIRRFETEAQLVARLEHPHIVPLYDFWRDPNGAYLVMRFLRGGSLRDSLEEHGAWEPRRVVQMVSQISAALAFAHHNGVIHRDLKTDNILLDRAGNTYLTDFGIAKNLEEQENLTRDNILGTPAYLSPEQIRGEVASAQSDIYALGIMTYEVLTGSKPFVDATPATVLYKQLHDPLPDLEEFDPDLPTGLNVILQRATSKDRDLRYESTLAFARDLASVIQDSAPGMPASGSTMDIASITDVEAAVFTPVNPYKGLRAFQQADAADFYGRDALINELLHDLSTAGKGYDFLAVVGPSGSGKSSIVKAGLLPRIQQGELDSEINWYTVEMVPGTHPTEELEAALLAIASEEIPSLLDQLRSDSRGLVRAMKRLLPDENSELVLYVDQFEEVFTLVDDEERRAHFLQSLLEAVNDERSRIKVVVTLRADFYDRPLLYSKFGELIRRRTELVLPLNEEELEEAITAPARRVGVVLEPGLVTAIIQEVGQRPGALPLLQYALTELFERREGRRMTLEAYHGIGGTTGALARRAEELYTSFDEAEQVAARQMFLRLVALGDGTEDTRRRVFQSELLSISKHTAAMREVIEQFGKYRLLTFDHDPQTRNSTVEVAHEALIRQWHRMRDWLDDNREVLRMHRRLTAASNEWLQSGKDNSFLVSGVRLQQFEAVAADEDIGLNVTERAYVDACVKAREERIAAEEAQRQREERLRRQRRNYLILAAGVMAVAAVVGFALAFVALQQRERAEAALVIAEENAARSDSLKTAADARLEMSFGDSMLGLSLALEAAGRYSPMDAETFRTLTTAAFAPGARFHLVGHEGSVVDTAFSGDGQYAASSSVDGTVRIWDTQSGEERQVLALPMVRLNGLAFHPDSTQIAAVGSQGMVYVWSFPDGELLYELSGHEGEALSIAYSPDGALLATGGVDHTVHLWDTSSGDEVRVIAGHVGTVLSLDFSPDGTQLVTGTGDETLLDTREDVQDRTVRLWDVASGELLREMEPRSGFVRAVAYSPLGDSIAIGVWDSTNSGTVRLYSVETGEELQRFFAHADVITDVAYSPDGRFVASSAWDRTVSLYEVQRGIETASFTGFGDRVLSLSYAPNGEWLLVALGNVGNNEFQQERGVDFSVYLWDLESRDQIAVFDDHEDWVWAADFHPDGTLAATAGGPFRIPERNEDGTVESTDTVIRVWDVETQEIVQELHSHGWVVDSLRFHPNGEWLLSCGWDGFLILWDIDGGESRQLYRGHEGEIFMVRFFADGERFVSGGADGTARIWETESGRELQSFQHDNGVLTVAISPDGTRLLTGAGNVVYLWDIESGDLLDTFIGHTDNVNEVLFSPDGSRIFSTSVDSTVRMWDVETGEELQQFVGHTGWAIGAALTSDGETLFTTSSDSTVRMWNVATGEELFRYERHTSWVLEVVLSPDESMILTAAEDDTARLWQVVRTLDEVQDYIPTHRYVRDLTCAERESYELEPCAE